MRVFSSRRRAVLVAALIVLLLFVLRPGASRLKSRIANSISAAVARPVEIGDVHVRLLPRPGFDLENLVVYEDPTFGAEPMLRAGEVTAILRLTALARGRLEVARLDLTEPSLNLVLGSNGRWNLEALLERSAQTSLAPTGNKKAGRAPGFPYIQASSGRINFKNGQEKRPYALTNADFALWQESENAWGVRLKAQPFRSDLNLSDTGLVRASGTWQRATSLHETPMQFSMEWDRPQLGQLSKFFAGNDKGWRGTVLLDVTLSGTPGSLQVSTDVAIRDFHRYDIPTTDALRLGAHCDAQYSTVDHVFHELFCRAPVGDGSLTVHGSVGVSGRHQYDLAVVAESVPASAVVALAQRAKKNLPEDLAAAGSVEGSFSLKNDGAGPPRFAGSGQIGGLKLSSAKSKVQLAPGNVPFELASGEPPARSKTVDLSSGIRLQFGPFPLAAGRSTTVVRGWIDRSEYRVLLNGDVEIVRALEAGRLLGIPTLSANVKGTAFVNLEVAGSWWEHASVPAVEFSQPKVTGTAKLHDVRAELRGLEAPLEISSADLQLLPDQVRVARLNAAAAETTWSGSLQIARGCGTLSACLIHFDLATSQVRLGDLSRWVNPRPKDRPWYRVLSSSTRSAASSLTSVRASGTVTANKFQIREVTGNHVSANVRLENGKLHISDLRGTVFGGEHRGEWDADFTARPPTYSGTGTFTNIALRRVAEAMGDGWVSGSASGSYELNASGSSGPEFWGSADGTLAYAMRDGLLPHISLVNESGPLHFALFEGKAELREGKMEIKNARLLCPLGSFGVEGTASLQRELDLKVTRSPMASAPTRSRGYTITGTVAEPEVVQIVGPETQARLKAAQQ